MSTYQNLFGKEDPQDATVTGWAEHGRVGGLSTGAGYKNVQIQPSLIVVDEPDDNTTYIGESLYGTATSAASWRVRRVLVTGTLTFVELADGNDNFDNVFDDRASLSYS